MNIGQAATAAGVSGKIIHHYEEMGRPPSPYGGQLSMARRPVLSRQSEHRFMTGGLAGSGARLLWRLAGFAGMLNLAWEIAQLPLYTIYSEGDLPQIAFAVAHCTGGDILIAVAST